MKTDWDQVQRNKHGGSHKKEQHPVWNGVSFVGQLGISSLSHTGGVQLTMSGCPSAPHIQVVQGAKTEIGMLCPGVYTKIMKKVSLLFN